MYYTIGIPNNYITEGQYMKIYEKHYKAIHKNSIIYLFKYITCQIKNNYTI